MSANVHPDEDDAWSDCEDADEEPRVAAVTDPTQLFGTAEEALAFDCGRGFDLGAIAKARKVDFYGAVKLLNYARHTVGKAAADFDEAAAAALTAACVEGDAWRGDDYMKPALEPDELLHRLEDVLPLEGDAPDTDAAASLRAELEAVTARV